MRFGILGPLSVTGEGREVAITAGRDRIVLAMLLLHAGRIVGMEQLIDAVWDEAPPATARGQLQTCVSRLRRLLPPGVILTNPAGYGVTVAADDVDATVFDQHVARARASAERDPDGAADLYRAALGLWRGPALTGIDSPAVRRGAAVLDEQHGAVIEDWIDLELAAGREGLVAPELTGLVERHPLRERLRGQLMLALYRLGRQSDALAEYRRTRELLDRQLGIEPGAALQELHRRILTGEVEQPGAAGPARAPVRSLPRTIGDFTGRDEVIERLLKATARTTVLAVDGMAGSGKTTLALRVAEILADGYPDAQLFLDLQGHSEGDPLEPGQALLALLRQLGVGAERIPADLDGRTGLWRSKLAGARALVILDNAAGSAQIARLLPPAPTCLVIVTSRRRLSGLDGVHFESVPLLDESEAIALLRRVVGERVDREPEAAREVVHRCGRLPLAIRLAGARLAHRPRWAVADLLRRLGESALPELSAEDRTVTSALTLSYRQLPVPSQRVFRLLGLHPVERFDAPAVAALAGLPLDEARDLLDDLVDVHLVEEPEPDHYRLHDLVRQYAVTLADTLAPQDRHAAVSGLIDFHLHVGVRQSRRLESDLALGDHPVLPPARPDLVGPVAARSEWAEQHRADLVPLIRAAAAVGEGTRAWQLARAAWRYLFVHGYFTDIIAVCSAGRAVAEEAGDERGVAVMSNYLASGYYRVGRPRDALSLVNKMLEFQIRVGDRAGEARARSNLGALFNHTGQLTQALAEADRAYRLLRVTSLAGGAMATRADRGTVALALGLHDDALRDARIALQAARENRKYFFHLKALLLVGHARMRLGAYGPAERLLRAGLREARRRGIPTEEGEALNLLGVLALAQGEPALAVERQSAALKLRREQRAEPTIARYCNDLACALAACGDRAGAAELHSEALTISRRISLPLEEGRALNGLASCSAASDPAAGRRYRQQAREIFTAMGVPEQLQAQLGR